MKTPSKHDPYFKAGMSYPQVAAPGQCRLIALSSSNTTRRYFAGPGRKC